MSRLRRVAAGAKATVPRRVEASHAGERPEEQRERERHDTCARRKVEDYVVSGHWFV
jgi:hypothetical protein